MSQQSEMDAYVEAAILNANPLSLNLPKSEENVINSRGEVLHVRTVWGDDCEDFLSGTPPKALLFCIHGVGGHTNRPTHHRMARAFSKIGIKLIAMDFHGHGYSENAPGDLTSGHRRALVSDCMDLVDDLSCLLKAVYSDVGTNFITTTSSASKSSSTSTTTTTTLVTTTSTISWKLKTQVGKESNIPFFLMGNSMGGAVALYASSILNKLKKGGALASNNSNSNREIQLEDATCFNNFQNGLSTLNIDIGILNNTIFSDSSPTPSLLSSSKVSLHIASCFIGTLLLSPALEVEKPHPIILNLIQYIAVPFFGSVPVPKLINSNLSDEAAEQSPPR